MKKCGKCKLEKDENDFHKNKAKTDGCATECKDCKKRLDIKYREENRDYYLNYLRSYREENKNELDAKKKVYISQNKEKHQTRIHKWYLKNQDSIKARVSLYKKEHPEQYQMYNNRRAASKKTDIVDIFTHQDIINKYGNKCFYCPGSFDHIDHYMPLSKGGMHTLENVRPSCVECNLTKSNKLPEEFIKYKGIKDE